ncbi:MAG TPA: CvpA family protein [Candidatus Omnitrophota bacterium]|nr:CvpA family protein [Candidatus Omnitrophota bacterium]
MDIFSKLGWIDVVSILLILWGLGRGLAKGLEEEFPRLVSVVFATIVTLHYYEAFARLITFENPLVQYAVKLISFILTAFLSIILTRFFFSILGSIATIKFNGVISKLGGAIVGPVRLMLFFSLVVFFLMLTPLAFFKQALGFERSVSGGLLLQASEKMHEVFLKFLPSHPEEKTGA